MAASCQTQCGNPVKNTPAERELNISNIPSRRSGPALMYTAPSPEPSLSPPDLVGSLSPNSTAQEIEVVVAHSFCMVPNIPIYITEQLNNDYAFMSYDNSFEFVLWFSLNAYILIVLIPTRYSFDTRPIGA
ncbi:hypothetical protein CPB83DRAFT_880136 [Crepidotus variabilis]|uniref:Uncharacterized protein n=1 Tax=Crepidotus variabilis TaxID=179855 RepID=A0A9P6EQN0_9AGAR|nr:hypothetical protein CPB83DRAFT_880136 [Crepidotus variabilis]